MHTHIALKDISELFINKHSICLLSDGLPELIPRCFLCVLLVLSNFAPYSF